MYKDNVMNSIVYFQVCGNKD